MPFPILSGTDYQPNEVSPEEAAVGYDKTISPDLLETLGAAGSLASNTNLLSQSAERGSMDPNASSFDKASAFFLKGQDPLQTYLNQQNNPQPLVTPQDAKKNYNLTIDHPVPENLVKLMATEQTQKAQQEDTLSRFENVNSWPVNTAVGLAGFIQDPLNIASLFIPGIGEERAAAIVGKAGLTGGLGFESLAGVRAATVAGRAETILSKGAATGLQGAALGVTSQTGSIGTNLIANPEYGLRDAAKDILYSSVSGAVLGSMFGMGDGLLSKTLDRTMTAETNHTAFSTAISQILDEKPISVADIFNLHDLSESSSSAPYDSEMFESDAQRSGRLGEEALQRNLGQAKLNREGEFTEPSSGYTLPPGKDDAITALGYNALRRNIENLKRSREGANWGDIEDRLSAFKDLYGNLDDTPTPVQMAKTQQTLNSTGYAQGVSQAEYTVAAKDLQDTPTKPPQPDDEKIPTTLPTSKEKPSTGAPEGSTASTPNSILGISTNPELTLLERQYQDLASKLNLTPGEQSLLDSTQKALQDGPKQDAAYAQAADCVKDI